VIVQQSFRVKRAREGLRGLIGCDGDALCISVIAAVVKNSLMLNAVVVPKGDHVGCPFYPALVSCVGSDALEKPLQNQVALEGRHV